MKLSKIFMTLTLAIAGVATTTSTTLATSTHNALATSSLNVRTGPSTSFDILDTLYRGELVQTHECRQGWCFISHAGPDGWVAARYLHEVSTPSNDYTPMRPSRPTTPWPLRPAPTPSYDPSNDPWPGPQIPWPFNPWPGNPNPAHPMPTEPQYQACNYAGTHYREPSECITPSRSSVHLGSGWSRNIVTLWAN